MLSPFGHRHQLELSTTILAADLRLTQQFARTQRDGYKFYGLRFHSSLGQDGDRQGWRVVRYNPPEAVEPLDQEPPVDHDDVEVIKSSRSSENPEFLEDTFFGERIIIDSSSEFQINPGAEQLHSIVFTPEGCATVDGDWQNNILTEANDEIILSLNADTKTITIIPLTGYVEIQ